MRTIHKFSFVVLIFIAAGCNQVEENTMKSNSVFSSGQRSQDFQKTITKDLSCKYLLFLPENYNEQEKEWPVILFLHGAGARGDDLEKVKVHGPPKIVATKKDFPFIVLSPQCPEDQWWTDSLDLLINLLDDITAQYKVDKDRIYLTGLSMGGFGTWALASRYPDRFAAIAPICGGALQTNAYALTDMPVWIFHGARDTTIPVQRSQEMYDLLIKRGGNVKITIYPNANHDSWTQTYNNQELYDWFLQNKLSDRKK